MNANLQIGDPLKSLLTYIFSHWEYALPNANIIAHNIRFFILIIIKS